MEFKTSIAIPVLFALAGLWACSRPSEAPQAAEAVVNPSSLNTLRTSPSAWVEESPTWIAHISRFPKENGPFYDAGESQLIITDKASGSRFFMMFSPWTAKQLEQATRELGEEVTLMDRPTRPYLQAVGVWDEGRWHFASVKGYATVPMMQLQVNPASAWSETSDAERPNDIWSQVLNGHAKLMLAYGENLEFGVFHLEWDRESKSIRLLNYPTLSEDFHAEYKSLREYADSGRILQDGLDVETF